MNDQEFLDHIEHSAAEVEAARLSVGQLRAIYEHHRASAGDLLQAGEAIQSTLRKVSAVHSTRVRVKTPKSLARKIVRKHTQDPERDITLENYREDVRDLIGLRALHLFKRDWKTIHREILQIWDLHPSDPEALAYYRIGDAPDLRQEWQQEGCKIEEKSAGYRSIHYVIVNEPNKRERYCAEIQVRTIFDEGWGEIDHHIRYPDDPNDTILQESLLILNRMAGSADEMGTLLLNLRERQQAMEGQLAQEAEARAQMAKELGQVKAALVKAVKDDSLSAEEGEELQAAIDRVPRIVRSMPTPEEIERVQKQGQLIQQQMQDMFGNAGGRTSTDALASIAQVVEHRRRMGEDVSETVARTQKMLTEAQRHMKKY